MSPCDLIFATGNPAKLAQLAYVIHHLDSPIRLIAAREAYGDDAIYEEIGDTPAAIARRGALLLAYRLGMPVAVEDTSFHVIALDGEPGIHAGEYLKEHGRGAIIEALKGARNREAVIRSAVAWASPYGDAQVWTNAVRGTIAKREWNLGGMPAWVGPSATNPLGGGYNAIFVPHGARRTLAEYPPEDAMQIGYREPNFISLARFIVAHG
jgi:XTP/dITP diphosphohydrolase